MVHMSYWFKRLSKNFLALDKQRKGEKHTPSRFELPCSLRLCQLLSDSLSVTMLVTSSPEDTNPGTIPHR